MPRPTDSRFAPANKKRQPRLAFAPELASVWVMELP